MSKQTEALKLALEALELCMSRPNYRASWTEKAITICKEALAEQPSQHKPLSMQERTSIVRANKSFHDKNEIDAYGIIDDVEAAHGIKENT